MILRSRLYRSLLFIFGFIWKSTFREEAFKIRQPSITWYNLFDIYVNKDEENIK